MLLNGVKTKATGQKMSELQGKENGQCLTRKLATSLFLKLGKPRKVQQKSWLNVVWFKLKVAGESHCLKANMTNAKMTINLSAGVCDYSCHFLS